MMAGYPRIKDIVRQQPGMYVLSGMFILDRGNPDSLRSPMLLCIIITMPAPRRSYRNPPVADNSGNL